MNTPVQDRERKVDMKNKTPEEVDNLSQQIGEKLRKMIDPLVEEANKFLKIYGLKCKMQFALEPLQDENKGE